MDFRLKLLLHVPLGLSLDDADLARLWALDLNPDDKVQTHAAVRSLPARKYLHRCHDWEQTSDKILKLSEQHGIRWAHQGMPDYPENWRNLSHRPPLFSYQGEPCWLELPPVAVVGSRNPSTDTLTWLQRELSEFLRKRPSCVVSGGARGVDQWAHRLAIEGKRPTVCVFPSGLLNPYPFECESLWRQIRAAGGCLLSTCSLYEPLRKSFFHMRNRWIAGMGRICFVAEANRRSGSALTAKVALEEDRDVCTLPVFPTTEQGLANLDLLGNGALMLRDHHDLVTLWDRVHSGLSPRSLHNLEGKE